MNKRSAMVVAAGLVVALLAGGAALSFSLSGGTAVAQDGGRVKPIVKTEHRTVRIHKQAKAEPAEVVTLSSSTGSIDATTGVSSTDDASAYEDEHGSEHEDDAFEQTSPHDHPDGHESGGDD